MRTRLLCAPVLVATAGLLAACGGGGHPQSQEATGTSARARSTTTTTTTTVPAPTTTTVPKVSVPNVVGLKILPARLELQKAGFQVAALNKPCNKGTLASQSVVASLSIAGPGANPAAGALPLMPGTPIAHGTRVAITWSGCFGDQSVVPNVHGMNFALAKRALTRAGLTWACFSLSIAPAKAIDMAETTPRAKDAPAPQDSTTTGPTTTTTTIIITTTTTTTTTTTAPLNPKTVHQVVRQDPAAGAVVPPGTTVSVAMPLCPN